MSSYFCALVVSVVIGATVAQQCSTSDECTASGNSCDIAPGVCFKRKCLYAQDPECVDGARVVKSLRFEKPKVATADMNLKISVDHQKKISLAAAEVEFLLTDRPPVSVAVLDRITTQLNSRADTSEADITRLEGEITETKEVLGKDLSDKIKAVEGNFKNTVDATLTPAVNSLTETTVALKFRILKLESVCAFDQFTKVPASGNTVENFKRPDCRDYVRCKKGKEFESKAPTKTTDRECQAAKICDSSEFIAAEVSEKKNRECRKLTVCNKEQWRSKQETAVSDRVCSKVTVCGTGYVEEKKPTATSDRKCKLSPRSCKDYVGIKKENGVYTIKPGGAATAFPAYCNMKRDGGGWTLVLINSDDNQPSVFRGSQLPRGLGSQTKGKYFGSPTQRNYDYK
eukprot:gene23465-30937_t